MSNPDSDEVVNNEPDMVNHPPHYTAGPCELIEALEVILTDDEFNGFLLGNMLKYRWRRMHKGTQVQDWRKSEWYRNKYIEVSK